MRQDDSPSGLICQRHGTRFCTSVGRLRLGYRTSALSCISESVGSWDSIGFHISRRLSTKSRENRESREWFS